MYDPSIHTATNKPVGIIGKPVDARTYFYDAVNFKYRPYVNSGEVLAYLTTASSRQGNFPIIINTGGSLSAGVITGGANTEYWFKDGVTDGDLVLKTSGGGGGSAAKFSFNKTTASSLSIANWQTNVPPGQTLTYAALLGNLPPNPLVDLPTGVTNQKERIPADFKYITNDDGSLILSATLDWSVTYDLVIITF